MSVISHQAVSAPSATPSRSGATAPWRPFALGCFAAALLFVLDRLDFRLANPGTLLLVVVAWGSVLGGTSGGLLSTIPCLLYAVYASGRGDAPLASASDDVQRVATFAACAVAVSVIVGRATMPRRRREDGPVETAPADGRTLAAEREQLNRAVLDSLPAHVAVIDADGRILITNKAWQRFQEANGGTPSICDVGSNYLAACRCEAGDGAPAAAEIASGIAAVLGGVRDAFAAEYPCHSPHEKRWFMMSVTPLVAADSTGVRGAVVTHLNITERKLSEEATRQRAAELAAMARALKRTNEELDQFAYITSHDLRAPLRGIANLSLWIEEDMGDRFTPEAHKQMELLRGRVHRMEAMIDGILEYSRIGRVRVEPERFEVAALLADVADLLDPPPGIELVIGPGMPVVIGHRLGLQQVFMNLIGNAIKYHDKPTGRIVVGCRDALGFFEFSVRDDGPGIDARYHDKIFVIFQTLQPRDKVESTGVGLSLVKKIVEGEGGTVAVDSELGRGSTFRFTWPKGRTGHAGAPGGARAGAGAVAAPASSIVEAARAADAEGLRAKTTEGAE